MDTQKPGVKTSEFWVTLAALGIAVLTGMGILSAADGEQLQTSAGEIAQAAAALITAITPVAYVIGRSVVKSKKEI